MVWLWKQNLADSVKWMLCRSSSDLAQSCAWANQMYLFWTLEWHKIWANPRWFRHIHERIFEPFFAVLSDTCRMSLLLPACSSDTWKVRTTVSGCELLQKIFFPPLFFFIFINAVSYLHWGSRGDILILWMWSSRRSSQVFGVTVDVPHVALAHCFLSSLFLSFLCDCAYSGGDLATPVLQTAVCLEH